MNDQKNKSEQSPNDPKLSDRVGLAGRVPPGETQKQLPEIANAPDEEARGMTARSSSLERLVRRLSFVLAEKNEEIRWAAVDAVSDEELQSNMDEIAASIIQRLFR